MPNRELLDVEGDKVQYIHHDTERPDDLIIETVYGHDRALAAAKLISELPPGKDFRHAAVIPGDVLDRSIREHWVVDDWKKWANDSDNRDFRTWQGRL